MPQLMMASSAIVCWDIQGILVEHHNIAHQHHVLMAVPVKRPLLVTAAFVKGDLEEQIVRLKIIADPLILVRTEVCVWS